jgi:hypothetical protein
VHKKSLYFLTQFRSPVYDWGCGFLTVNSTMTAKSTEAQYFA